MTINKFIGKTKEEAIEKAKRELGSNAVIMNVKEIRPKGIFRAFRSTAFEVTAAMEEKEDYVSPLKALMGTDHKPHDNINLAADEKISIPPLKKGEDPLTQKTNQIQNNLNQTYVQPKPVKPALGQANLDQESINQVNAALAQMRKEREERVQREEQAKKETKHATMEDKKIEERLDNLSNMLEERLGVGRQEVPLPEVNSKPKQQQPSEKIQFMRMLYTTLVNNEVNEKYVNQIIDEIEKLIRPGNSVDTMLSNVYQKLILRFGQPCTIELSKKKPKVVFVIGPTGVGKTTTIAKIASKYKVEYNRKIAFVTADTYRIAATEQLRVYANILDAPMSIVYDAKELNEAIDRLADHDLVFVDTAGFSHKNVPQRKDMKQLIQGLDAKYEKEVYLVLSATTKYEDLLDIVDIYHDICEYKLIFTKLDETSKYGNILNIRLYSDASLSYVTDGQNVPDDIEVFETQKIVKHLLGGK